MDEKSPLNTVVNAASTMANKAAHTSDIQIARVYSRATKDLAHAALLLAMVGMNANVTPENIVVDLQN